MRDLIGTILALALAAAAAHAAEQRVLGSQRQVKDPTPGVDATKRAVVVRAKERASGDTIVGDPTASGATLTVFVTGASSAGQVFVLPAGTDPASGKAFWSATG